MDLLEQAGFSFHIALEELPDDELRDVVQVIEKSGHGAPRAALEALRETAKAEFARRAHLSAEEPCYEFRGTHYELLAGTLFAESLASLTANEFPATARLWKALGRLLAVTTLEAHQSPNPPRELVN